MRTHYTFLLVIAITAATPAMGEDLRYTALHSYSEISGAEGDGTYDLPETVPLNQSEQDLALLNFVERGDEPCLILAENWAGTRGWHWNGCHVTYPTLNGSVRALGTGSLKKLRVCTNNQSGPRGGLIKGVESEWVHAPYFRNGVQPYNSQFSRAHCQNWHEWVSCPATTSAGALRIHHKVIDGKDTAVGLQLICYNSISATHAPYTRSWRRGTARWTGFSGASTTGSDIRTLDYSLAKEPHGEQFLLSGLGVAESMDEPTFIKIFARHNTSTALNFDGDFELSQRFNLAEMVLRVLYPEDPNDGGRRTGLRAGQYNARNSKFSVENTENKHMRGISVCVSGSGKVKGVRIEYARRFGRGLTGTVTREDSLPNCSLWDDFVRCSDDEAVVGMRYAWNGSDGLKAIALQCADLENQELD